jgi:hypothetical protein
MGATMLNFFLLRTDLTNFLPRQVSTMILSISVFQVAVIIGMRHHTWLRLFVFNVKDEVQQLEQVLSLHTPSNRTCQGQCLPQAGKMLPCGPERER